MSETALYRKYRPQQFNEVSGQDTIVETLKSAIKLGNIAHAYIFAGSRGTGKTSVARIFARDIGTSIHDLTEIDAASHTGVDDIRALNESVSSLPFESPYKVYLLDEAHMLSKSAWNALLKTIEEPPKHAIFIFATTEVTKIPETVISRCQLYNFKKPTHATLKDVVTRIAKKEGFVLESAAAELIALLGDGSFRDATGTLQKVLSISGDKKITVDEVARVTGAPKAELVNDYLRAIDTQDASVGLSAIRTASEAGLDMLLYYKLLLAKSRAILLLRVDKMAEKHLAENFTDTDFSFIRELAGKSQSNINSESLLTLLSHYDLAQKAVIPELPLELALLAIIR